MRISFESLVGALMALALSFHTTAAADTSAAPVFHFHSVGSSGFLMSTQGLVFQQVWKMPEAEPVRAQLQSSIGKAFLTAGAGLLEENAASLTPSAAELLRDVIEHESWLDVRGAPGKLEWVLVTKVPEARHTDWAKAWESFSKAGGCAAPSSISWGGVSGSAAKSDKQTFSWVSAQGWFAVGLGPAVPSQWEKVLSTLKASGRPASELQTNWLRVKADLGRLRAGFPMIPEFVASQLDLTFRGRGEMVRTEGTLRFSEPLNWKPEPWDIPANHIRDPLVGFTAARGIEPLLRRYEEAKKLGLQSYPNQAVSWSLGVVPYFLYATYPQQNVSNILWHVLPKLPSVITNHGDLSGSLSFVTNNAAILWQGMPFMAPALKPLWDGTREYLLAAMAPPPGSKLRPPTELFSFMSKSNLAFYEWEITEERVSAWRTIYQATLLGFLRNSPKTNAASFKWMEALGRGRRLGNTATEVTVTGPNELTVTRTGHAGLTGFEIVSMLRWFDSSNFPFTFEPTPKMDFKQLAIDARARRMSNNPTPPAPRIPVPPTPPSRQLPTGGTPSPAATPATEEAPKVP
ncbi:MAG: hypothetical protein FJ405_09035 [Verrucomicrobia bacterium]|nr:hypothetical protein [Verrucomicrobiota bacterium]